MPTFIALPDLHDKSDLLKLMGRELMHADAVLLAGDMTNGAIHQLLRLLSILEEFNEQIYAVNGNMDTHSMLGMLAREGMSLHRRHEICDGVVLAGVGGALPFAGKFVFTEAQLAQMLDESIAGAPDLPLALVCHQPPYGTALDRVGATHVGSHAVRDFILRVQPLVCFTGHIHEATGIDTLGRTTLINPGPAWQTNAYAYTEIEAGRLSLCEIRPITPESAKPKRSHKDKHD
jgi:Icc-related predicted phosphoesterase